MAKMRTVRSFLRDQRETSGARKIGPLLQWPNKAKDLLQASSCTLADSAI